MGSALFLALVGAHASAALLLIIAMFTGALLRFCQPWQPSRSSVR